MESQPQEPVLDNQQLAETRVLDPLNLEQHLYPVKDRFQLE